MTHAFATFAVPFDNVRADDVDRFLEPHGRRLRGDGDLRKVLRGTGVHFMSITVVRGGAGERAHLVIEMSVDGPDSAAEAVLGGALADELRAMFEKAGVVAGASIGVFVASHRVRTGQGLFDVPGLDFTGTPGMTVDRIDAEFRLARKVRDELDKPDGRVGTALARLRHVRASLAGDTELAPLFRPEPVASLPLSSDGGAFSSPGKILGLVASVVWTVAWPLLVVLGAAVILASGFAMSREGWLVGFGVLVASVLAALAALAAIFALGWRALRRLEVANTPDDSLPDSAILEEVFAHENLTNQNHLAGVSTMQAGWLRGITLRLAFKVILSMAARHYRPGFLGDIGTIHFARWVLLPNTDKLLFFSNYGGSWESYLEDFITKASAGLTAAWSNTVGFPRTESLFLKGATDGDRFKRWARRQQRPTRFWYSAYPHLTTARIRTNAAIRQGLANAATEDEAEAWFGLMGSVSRPVDAIETEEVQTLFFGGLRNHGAGATLVCDLPGDEAGARAWLREIEPLVTFGDSPHGSAVHVLGLSAEALRRLALPRDTLDRFPLPFRLGMAHPTRGPILADTGDDKPSTWLWGAGGGCEAVVNVYCDTGARLAAAVETIRAGLSVHGGKVRHQVTLAEPARPADGAAAAEFPPEPFGFADGISQPVVRGTRRWTKQTDAIHAVEPGEFLYGYPDNRGYRPLSPGLAASADPGAVLAAADPTHSADRLIANFSTSAAGLDRDFGRNGSFLVLRQLEQDVDAFDGFLARSAAEVAGRPELPKHLDEPAKIAHWIGAKMVGRWKDGTSLVRFPNRPGSGWDGKTPARPDNDYLFGAEDPAALRCPFGSHVRRANPRESFRPGSREQLAIVNRHRILRRGRPFEAAGSGDPKSTRPGLMFMCLNLDIERQFEFIQQTWAMAGQFHGLENEVDPVLSRGGMMGRLTIPTVDGPLQIKGMKDFVRVRGGGYYFLPGKRSLRYLAG